MPPSTGPWRTCVGCRKRAPADTLVRVARRRDGSLVVSRDAPGRGAWLCRDPETGAIHTACLEAAVRRNTLSRAFRSPLADQAWEPLRAACPERANMEMTPPPGQFR